MEEARLSGEKPGLEDTLRVIILIPTIYGNIQRPPK